MDGLQSDPDAKDVASIIVAIPMPSAVGWLKKHALTRADLEQEKKYLKAVNVLLAFEK